MKTETKTAFKRFFKKYWLVLICLAVILILCGYCIKLKNIMGDKPIVGTYILEGTDTRISEDILVFLSDGKYAIYKQGEPIREQGTYRKEEEIIRLEYGDESANLICVNQLIYDLRDNQVKIFEKIHDVPVFISVVGEVP